LHRSSGRDADAAIIGFGSGVTVGAAMQFPLRSAEVMELERSVVEASRFFRDVNHLQYRLPDFPFVESSRLRVINDDGRNYLASTDRRYDVIIGEPSNPWLTGVADLFTADHFRIAKKKLRPGGVYCEWVQLYEMSPENVKTIYRTFASQFRYMIVFSAEDLSSDTVLVGSDAPLALDYEHLAAGFRQPRVAAELERAYVHSPYDLLARLLLTNRDEVLRYTELERRLEGGRWQPKPAATNAAPCPAASCRRTPAPINTDDNALIEFAAPRDLIGFERYKGYLQTIYASDWPYGRLGGHVRGLDGPHGSERHAELAMALLAHGRKREAGEAIARARSHGPSASLGLASAMHAALSATPLEPALGVAAPAPDPALTERSNERMQRGYVEVRDWLSRGDAAAAKAALDSIPASLLKHFGSGMRLLRGYVLYRSGDHDQAVGELEAIARSDPEFTRAHPELYFFLGRAHDALTHFDKAVRSIRAYVETGGAR
jgi:tetratricopeptide (TPR) repeat protein